MYQKKVNIKNNYNKDLSVIIEAPKNNIKDFIIISHCFTCSKLYKLYYNISNTLVENGYGVIRYDAMGLGESKGNFENTSFSTNVEDLISVHNYISNNYKEPRYLFGHSLGGLVSIKAANILNSIIGVATVGTPSNFDILIELFSNYKDELEEKDSIVINLSGRNINFGLNYLNDIRNENIDGIIKNFNKSIIIFHSNSDKTVPYSNGLKLFNSINSQKNFITLKNVDHLVNNREDSLYIGDILSSWLQNH